MKYLSKKNSEGKEISIIEHSKLVGEFAKVISKLSLRDKTKVGIIENARLSGILHDIGKYDSSFQDYIQLGNVSKNFDWHNEVGWSFLSRNLVMRNEKDKEYILNSIYWHHGINKKKRNDEILISESDNGNMISFLDEFNIEHLYNDSSVESPEYYYSPKDMNDLNDRKIHDNMMNTFYRMCLISADRIVSSLESENGDLSKFLDSEEIENYLLKVIDRSSVEKFDVEKIVPPYGENPRYSEQKKVSKVTGNTIKVTASGGFGKTLCGLLWGLNQSNRKIIWVCPRNGIAESVYESITSELDKLGQELTIELYLTGEVKKSNHQSSGFDSDIIITNIDNMLSPTVNNSHSGRLFLINNSSIIFDEYHEFMIGDSAMISCFFNLMNLRHRMCDCKTLLISATDYPFERYWSMKDIGTINLPSEGESFSTPHEKKYLLKMHSEFNVFEDSSFNDNSSSLIMFQSTSNAQKFKELHPNTFLYHSGFESKVKEEKMGEIFRIYGKTGDRSSLTKVNVVSTHVLQSSLDISFKHLHLSCISPQNTIQTIARIDRWGSYDGESILNLYLIDNQSERSIKKTLYDVELSKKWFNYLKFYDNQYLTIRDFNEIYKSFHIKYEKEINIYIRSIVSGSYKKLSTVSPYRFFGNIDKSRKRSGGNVLRSVGDEIFYISFKTDGTLTEPFSKILYNGFDKDFSEPPNILGKLIKILGSKVVMNDSRYNFSEFKGYIKKVTIDHLRKKSVYSDTPYIRLDGKYDDEYGFRKD